MGRGPHRRSLVVLELAAEAIDLRLEVLLARKETVLVQKRVLKVGECADHTGEVGAHTLRETRDRLVLLRLRGLRHGEARRR